jgi:hypothetical protein
MNTFSLSATPLEKNVYTSKRRKHIDLLCFLIAIRLAEIVSKRL